MGGTRLLSLNVMQKMFSKIKNQHGSHQLGCLLILLSPVGIFLAILIPQWSHYVDRIRDRGGSTEEVWIASILLFGSPIALTVLVGWVIALLDKRKDREKICEGYFDLMIVSLGVTSFALSATAIILGLVIWIGKLF